MKPCLLVVAKAPVPGLAKTRLCPPATPEQAAAIAAAALLDTLDAVLSTPDTYPVVAMTGELHAASRAGAIAGLLRHCTVLGQRGDDFAHRLANAHCDVAQRFPGASVLQVGMDTPQLTPDLLGAGLASLRDTDAVLGAALDGGWWALGLREPRAALALRTVPMSHPDTGRLTGEALRRNGLRVGHLPALSDVDTMADALAVAEQLPCSRFATAVSDVDRLLVAR